MGGYVGRKIELLGRLRSKVGIIGRRTSMKVEIEGKWFLAGWTNWNLTFLTEQVRGQSFRRFITKQCCIWMVEELRKLIAGYSSDNKTREAN